MFNVCNGLYQAGFGSCSETVNKYMANPSREHWNAVKWIFRYLNGTTGYGILFARQHGDNSVVGYVNSNYAGNIDDIRSTTSYVFTLSGRPICWRSTLQSLVAISTTKAEYMAVAEAAKEALWLKGFSQRAWFEPRRSSVAM